MFNPDFKEILEDMTVDELRAMLAMLYAMRNDNHNTDAPAIVYAGTEPAPPIIV